MLRRFTKRILIPLPDIVARRALVLKLLEKQNKSRASGFSAFFQGSVANYESGVFTSSQIDTVAKDTEGYSASDITALIKEAAMGPIRSLTPEQMLSIKSEDVRPINYNVCFYFSSCSGLNFVL